MSNIQKSGDNVLRELLDLVGGPVVHQPEDIEQILKAGVPHMLRAQLDLVLGGASEKTKAFIANGWLDRALGSAAQRIQISQRVEVLDARTLDVLQKVMAEDAIDVRVCDPTDAGNEPVAAGADPGGAPAGTATPEVSEQPLLSS